MGGSGGTQPPSKARKCCFSARQHSPLTPGPLLTITVITPSPEGAGGEGGGGGDLGCLNTG